MIHILVGKSSQGSFKVKIRIIIYIRKIIIIIYHIKLIIIINKMMVYHGEYLIKIKYICIKVNNNIPYNLMFFVDYLVLIIMYYKKLHNINQNIVYMIKFNHN